MNTNQTKPAISVVIIGINVEAYISECIASVLNSNYPKELIEIIYVDGGSNDSSTKIAKSFPGVKTIELKDRHPTPGRGRNAGYQAAGNDLIQFMDADVEVHPNWLNTAVPYVQGDIGAVRGKRIEKYPHKNNYHLIGHIEWNITAGKSGHHFREGPCNFFGGDVLIKKSVLEAVDGFDALLVAGEDPDISYRVRRDGWIIYQLDVVMTTHDLNMTTFKQYLKRAHRSGHAYAEIGFRYIRQKEKLFLRQLLRISGGALLPFILLGTSAMIKIGLLGVILALLIALRPLIKIFLKKKAFGLTTAHAVLYGAHLSFVIYPQFIGIMRYVLTMGGKEPLKNKGYQS